MQKLGFLLFLATLCTFFACSPPLQGLQVQKMDTEKVYTLEDKAYKLPRMKEDDRVFFLVRHAEKEKQGRDPNLTTEGTARAEKLAKILESVPVSAIYTSDYQRTKLTAKPTALQTGVDPQFYNPRKLADFLQQLKKEVTKGAYTLVVGHSNSTPDLLNLFAGKKVYEHISEKIYDNLYMVILSADGETEVISFKY